MADLTGAASTTCVSDAALAAYVDGHVTSEERARIEAHVSSCEDCYLLLGSVLQTEEDLAAEPPEPRVLPFYRRRGVMAGGGLLALAASLVVFVLLPGDPLGPLVSAVGEQRLTLARTTGGFAYGPLRSALRSSGGESGDLRLQAAAGELRERAASGEPGDLHAWGVAQLVLGRTSESVQTLEQAVSAAPDEASHHADLGAAQLTQYLEGRRPEDAAAALASLTRALAIDPSLREALFNRALVFEAMGQREQAIAAWDDYLARDPESEWADEARRRQQSLR